MSINRRKFRSEIQLHSSMAVKSDGRNLIKHQSIIVSGTGYRENKTFDKNSGSVINVLVSWQFKFFELR